MPTSQWDSALKDSRTRIKDFPSLAELICLYQSVPYQLSVCELGQLRETDKRISRKDVNHDARAGTNTQTNL